MALIFKYAILMAIPDARRGERVNVGIVVFLKDRVDVRLSEITKISVLAPGDWKLYASELQRKLSHYDSGLIAEKEISEHPKIDAIISATSMASFVVDALEQYEVRVKEILDALVIRPKIGQAARASRINTEISQRLRSIKVLAKPTETINDHRVVRDFPISEEEKLVADFALKNGVWHIIATLDLRKSSAHLGDAALKAVTLDKAKRKYKKNIRRYSIYAAVDNDIRCKPQIALLRDYSESIFNWSDCQDQKKIIGLIRQAAAPGFNFG
jgi:hypothetical protein